MRQADSVAEQEEQVNEESIECLAVCDDEFRFEL
jgi:hypothetical protein